jgi:hypothetical protein
VGSGDLLVLDATVICLKSMFCVKSRPGSFLSLTCISRQTTAIQQVQTSRHVVYRSQALRGAAVFMLDCWLSCQSLTLHFQAGKSPTDENGRNHTRLRSVQKVNLGFHFDVEQRARSFMSWFFNFNGTAGVWRIEASGQFNLRKPTVQPPN